MIANKLPSEPSQGIIEHTLIDGKQRQAEVFRVQDMNSLIVRYAIIRKPHTDFGITVSVRKLK